MSSNNSSIKNKMKVIGLTGGIGTGKSTAAAYLKSKGFAHIDADEIGRRLTEDNAPLLLELDKSFHKVIIRTDNNISLDRKALAAIVFKDREKKAQLDSIMFKAIKGEIDRRISHCRLTGFKGYVLLDAPLLFEAGLENRCDKIILLVADEASRIHRVCSRDGVTPDQVRDRINSQLDDDEKAGRSHIVIDNSYGQKELYENLDKIFGFF